MKKKNVVVNYLYNMIYQVINIGAPIIVIPFISRVIGADGIGKYDYTYSCATLFVALGMFGINNYGSKRIASVRGSTEKVKENFWSIWTLQFISNSICIALYFILFILKEHSNLKLLFIMQFPMLLTAMFDISWLFIGLEDFKKTVTRNILVKLTGLALIFILVKSPDDLWIYAIVLSLSATIGNISFWFFAPKYVGKPCLNNINISRHVKGAFLLLIPYLAQYIYMAMDRIIIGNLTNDVQLAFYSNPLKVAQMPIVAITSLSQVMMPAIANLYVNNDKEKINEYLSKSVKFSAIFSIFISSALAAVAKDFVPMFFGNEFIPIIPYMQIISVVGIFMCIGGVFSDQYSLPTGQSLGFALPIVIAVFLNPVLNCILVPKYLALGGIISKVVTEAIILVTRLLVVRKKLNLKYMLKNIYKYLIAGVIAFVITNFVAQFLASNFISVVVEGMVNFVVYFGIIAIVDKEIFKLIKGIISKKNH